MVQGLGFRVSKKGFRVYRALVYRGSGDSGLGCSWGSGFRVQGVRFRV